MKEGFFMTIRELKVSQLNQILPIVRETLKKEEQLKKLREQANNIKFQINVIKNSVEHNTDMEASLKKYFNELKYYKNQIKETEDYIAASNLLFEGFSEMFNHGLLNCYQNGGVLEVSELKEDYIYEYAYLIQNTSSLTIYRLISMRPEVMEKVESIVKTELTSRKKIREYLKFAIQFNKLL